MFDIGIEESKQISQIAAYGPLYLVRFRDGKRLLVLEDETAGQTQENYLLAEV